ncbi:transporter [Herbaspirillum rubrisubalbicans]|jgi:chloramphenicol-sensitive protein RarD|uniref:Transporter n=2 Tax=Herbaspirillum rubrisubalbicans TaxID=80842 RepID=A0ABX9BW04_9BURK|nr:MULTISPECIES: EamA family transporter RarD [Herbaspirillum]NQE49893.1 transporter [Herbaspirillum rubrisubalbicans]QJQ03720.1 EamA family transporter RarD [Herbaspirillum rubrisubalbicans Os34]RAM62021.1 transporter [Herbaspirillum rubrisubalbicans]RAN43254.1 transporter [Herbaspirillum rubrisubalbicans]
MPYAVCASILWGLFPLYFKLLKEVPSFDIVVQRLFWSCVFLLAVLAWRRQWRWIVELAKRPLVVGGCLLSALLLSGNWTLYVWAVNAGRIVDTSLGYFMSPLMSVFMGYLILKEKMRPLQWLAVFLALGAVLWLTIANGSLPWISLLIALTFAFYGLLRKTAHLGALEGLSLETLLMLPLVLVILGTDSLRDSNAFTHASTTARILLILSGPITAVPLLLFAHGARRIPLSMLGLIQYISPTIQLLAGVLVYDEPFVGARAIGFCVIWAALAVYSAEGLWRYLRSRAQSSAEPSAGGA